MPPLVQYGSGKGEEWEDWGTYGSRLVGAFSLLLILFFVALLTPLDLPPPPPACLRPAHAVCTVQRFKGHDAQHHISTLMDLLMRRYNYDDVLSFFMSPA